VPTVLTPTTTRILRQQSTGLIGVVPQARRAVTWGAICRHALGRTPPIPTRRGETLSLHHTPAVAGDHRRDRPIHSRPSYPPNRRARLRATSRDFRLEHRAYARIGAFQAVARLRERVGTTISYLICENKFNVRLIITIARQGVGNPCDGDSLCFCSSRHMEGRMPLPLQ